MQNIGFMQGRLSEVRNGIIQEFPWKTWELEFARAKSLEIFIMEWTLDYENLYKNPLMTKDGQLKIKNLCKDSGISIPSITGDCFMQSPFWKVNKPEREILLDDFINIIHACGALNIEYIVIPLVDNGSLSSKEEEIVLIESLLSCKQILDSSNVKILFEIDLPPKEVSSFIYQLNPDTFGINYDIGNSASLGYEPKDEFFEYGQRVLNVHVKDRIYKGKTVPLGEGDANFEQVFSILSELGYQGNYILQTARSYEGKDSQVLIKYKNMTSAWINKYAT